MNASHAPSFSVTTRFIAACCRWPQDAAAQAELGAAARDIRDWGALETACRRHRVVGLVHHAIKAQSMIDDGFAMRMKLGAQRTAALSMQQAQTAVEITQCLQAAGIDAIQFKGPSLSQIAYGKLAIKRSKDLDFLVGPDDVPQALEQLERLGFRIETARYPLHAGLSAALIRHRNQIEVIGPRGLVVEVHWRLANAPGLLQQMEQNLQTQMVEIEGYGTIPTLGDEDLFAYLCQHGALHDWGRLRWLADVAAFLNAQGSIRLEPLVDAARLRGAGLAAEQSVLLCHLLFATPAPKRSSERAQALARHALRSIEAPFTRQSLLSNVAFNLRKWRMHRHFYDSNLAALGLLRVHRASLDDIVSLPLPAGMDFLYPLLRIPRWLARKIIPPARLAGQEPDRKAPDPPRDG